MTKLSKSIAVIVLISFLFTSCKQKGGIGKMIPSNALAVGFMDTKSLMDKLPIDQFKTTQMYKDIMADSSLPAWGKTFMENPANNGIDLDKGIVFFSAKGEGDNYNLVMEGSIKNAADFEKLNQSMDPAAKVEKDKDMSMITLKQSSVAVWNDKSFAYVFSTSTGAQDLGNWNQDTSLMSKIPKGNADAAMNYAMRLFSLPSDSVLSGESHFNDLLNEKGDMKVWINNEQIFKSIPSMGVLGMLKLDALIKDTRTGYIINFANGEIDITQKGFYGKDLTSLIKKYKGDAVTSDEFGRIPSSDVDAAIAFNFKPEGIKEVLKLIGLDGMANSYGTQLGLTLDDFVSAIDGHILLSFSDFKLGESKDSTPSLINGSSFNLLFKMGIRDKAKFQKLTDALNQMMGITSATAFKTTDKEFVVSNNAAFADNFIAGKAGNKADWISQVTGEPGALYININKLLSAIPTPNDEFAKGALEKSKSMWGEVFTKGGKMDGDVMTGTTRITLQDKSTNSLKTLNTYFDQMYQLAKQSKKTWNAPLSNPPDSSTIPADSSALINP